MVGRCFSYDVIPVNVTSDTADLNVHVAAGSPAAAADIVVTIAAGVVVYQNAATAALRTGSVPAGRP